MYLFITKVNRFENKYIVFSEKINSIISIIVFKKTRLITIIGICFWKHFKFLQSYDPATVTIVTITHNKLLTNIFNLCKCFLFLVLNMKIILTKYLSKDRVHWIFLLSIVETLRFQTSSKVTKKLYHIILLFLGNDTKKWFLTNWDRDKNIQEVHDQHKYCYFIPQNCNNYSAWLFWFT